MGGEFGQASEWRHDASLDWHLCQYMDHEGIRLLVRDMNKLYAAEPALSATDLNPRGFRWLACNDADANIIAYLRCDPDEKSLFAIVCHFGAGVTREAYLVGVPRRGFWKEVINTNSEYYGGTGVGNGGGLGGGGGGRDGFSQSLKLKLPPLTAFVFKWQPE
jgi:1,4-alpha-glucan branching enzyme